MNCGALGRNMLIVDASCLYEVLRNGRYAQSVRSILSEHDEHAAPSVIDAECMGLLRRDLLRGDISEDRAWTAHLDLRDWPGERFTLEPFNERVWELRNNVRTWDAYYIALAEVLDAPLLTLDRRLASAQGPRCTFEIP